MGVMICNRGNCENIMCDRYSHKYGHICRECFEELVQRGVRTKITTFMKTNVPEDRDAHRETAHNHFNGIFQL